nr:MAG TPA: hypothetical protein [Crassvirales sp.]
MICLSKKGRTLYNQLNWGGESNFCYPPFFINLKK